MSWICLLADNLISALTFDWIAGNIFGVSWAGIVFVCKARVKGLMKCAELHKDQGILHGVDVSPADR